MDVPADYNVTIDGRVYAVPPIAALESFALQPRLAPAILGLVADLFEAMRAWQAETGEGDKPPEKPTADDVAEGAGKADFSDEEVEKVLPRLLPAATRFFSHFSSGELRDITVELLSTATCDGKMLFNRVNGKPSGPQPFDVLMQGRTFSTWRLLFHAVRVNYPDFFGVFAAALRDSRATATASSAT